MWHQTAIRLRSQYPKVGVGRLCDLFGKTRHAYYDSLWHHQQRLSEEELVIEMLLEIKRDMPGAGIPTIYRLLRQPLLSHGIKMGRDAVQALRREAGLMDKPRRKYMATTNSNHRFRKYPNIIKELRVYRPEQLWVADITYIRVAENFNFLSLVLDAYSRKIVGYCLHPTLAKEGPLSALRMAIEGLRTKSSGQSLIHHSDRGIQYCCDDYVAGLQMWGIAISMTENGDPYENALAERLNGILKKTFGLGAVFESRESAVEKVDRAVVVYNTVRPHTGIDNLVPEQAHGLNGDIARAWKKMKSSPDAAAL